MKKHSLYIFEFTEGALGMIHSDEYEATFYVRQRYDLPDLKCTFECPLPPTNTFVPTLIFIRGLTSLRMGVPQRSMSAPVNNDKSMPNEQVYNERRSSPTGPAHGIKEVDDYSAYAPTSRMGDR